MQLIYCTTKELSIATVIQMTATCSLLTYLLTYLLTASRQNNWRDQQSQMTNFAKEWQHVIEHVLKISLWAASSWRLEFAIEFTQMHQTQRVVDWLGATSTTTATIIWSTQWPLTWWWPRPRTATTRRAHQLPHEIHLVYNIQTALLQTWILCKYRTIWHAVSNTQCTYTQTLTIASLCLWTGITKELTITKTQHITRKPNHCEPGKSENSHMSKEWTFHATYIEISKTWFCSRELHWDDRERCVEIIRILQGKILQQFCVTGKNGS